LATLDPIAGTILEDTFPFKPGSNDPMGNIVDSTVVNGNNTALGDQSIGNRLKVDIEVILTDGSLDPGNLTDFQKNHAQLALNWACIHEFMRESWISFPFGSKDDETRANVKMRLGQMRDNVCNLMNRLNLSWPQFCTTKWSILDVTLEQHCKWQDHL